MRVKEYLTVTPDDRTWRVSETMDDRVCFSILKSPTEPLTPDNTIVVSVEQANLMQQAIGRAVGEAWLRHSERTKP